MRAPLFYRRNGTPYEGDDSVVCLQWAKDLENKDRVVKQGFTWWGAFVSTIYLGIDHSFGVGPPLIFETMVFSPLWFKRISGSLELRQERYPSENESLRGHERIFRQYSSPAYLAGMVCSCVAGKARDAFLNLWRSLF